MENGVAYQVNLVKFYLVFFCWQVIADPLLSWRSKGFSRRNVLMLFVCVSFWILLFIRFSFYSFSWMQFWKFHSSHHLLIEQLIIWCIEIFVIFNDAIIPHSFGFTCKSYFLSCPLLKFPVNSTCWGALRHFPNEKVPR